MSFRDKINEKLNDGIQKMAMEVYGMEKDELMEIQKEIYTRDIVGNFENLTLREDIPEGLFWAEIRGIEDMLSEEVANFESISYSSSKNLKLENIDGDSFFNVGGPSSEVDRGFDYSPIKKKLKARKSESEKEKFISDMRDAALSLANMDIDKSNISVDLYSIMSITINIGMMKGRGEYIKPYKEKIKREKELRKNTPTDTELAKEWGYESPSEI